MAHVALIAGLLGFTGIAVAPAGIAKFLFFLFLVMFLIFLIMGISVGKKVLQAIFIRLRRPAWTHAFLDWIHAFS